MSNEKYIKKYSNNSLKSKTQDGLRTTITHKRGSYTDNTIKGLKDGEVFYDTDGKRGVWIGKYNDATGKVDAVQVATVGGGGGGVPEDVIKTADVVGVIRDDETYSQRQVASAEAVKSLRAVITENIIKKSDIQSSDSLNIEEGASGSLIINVRTDDTLAVTGEGVGMAWVQND